MAIIENWISSIFYGKSVLFDIKNTTVERWIMVCMGSGICRDTNLHTYMDGTKKRDRRTFLQLNKLDNWYLCINVLTDLCYTFIGWQDYGLYWHNKQPYFYIYPRVIWFVFIYIYIDYIYFVILRSYNYLIVLLKGRYDVNFFEKVFLISFVASYDYKTSKKQIIQI